MIEIVEITFLVTIVILLVLLFRYILCDVFDWYNPNMITLNIMEHTVMLTIVLGMLGLIYIVVELHLQ